MLPAIAALTPAVSLLEVVVAYFMDEKGMSRRSAATLLGFLIFLLGIPSSLSFGVWKGFTVSGKNFFEITAYATSNLRLPIGGILIALYVGRAITPKAMEEATSEGRLHPFVRAPLWPRLPPARRAHGHRLDTERRAIMRPGPS